MTIKMLSKLMLLFVFLSTIIQSQKNGSHEIGELGSGFENIFESGFGSGFEFGSEETRDSFNVNQIYSCHVASCLDSWFNCGCRAASLQNQFNTSTPLREYCIDETWVCDGVADCADGSDEIDCICSDEEYQCNERCEPGLGCEDRSAVPVFQCSPVVSIDIESGCFNPRLSAGITIEECVQNFLCDGYIHCNLLNFNDEENCNSCPDRLPIRCDCNQEKNFTCKKLKNDRRRGATCYNRFSQCDGLTDCTDSSDELDCQCGEHEYTCDCIRKRTCTKQEGCINKLNVQDGFLYCPGSAKGLIYDRIPFNKFGRISINKFNNFSECNELNLSICDNTTCYSSNFLSSTDKNCLRSELICTSYLNGSNRNALQCANNDLIMLSQFCDGITDCVDGSDEGRNQPGFKCNQLNGFKCVLPQNNIYDDVAHCSDNSDLCFSSNNSCFKCLDNRLLISSKQVCDGVIDCYDLSDECLCERFLDFEICAQTFAADSRQEFSKTNLIYRANYIDNSITSFNDDTLNFTVTCQTKFFTIIANLCDGRPECKDYSDECNCKNPPDFCSDPCHNFFPMGDRYCDGVEDPAWAYINKSTCPQGFDEKHCPKRFKCGADGKVSIDVLQICDGKVDCDDQSDEMSCADSRAFSSETEMIASPGIRSAFWIIGFLVIMGNTGVIVSTILFLKRRKKIDSLGFQHIIILNISIADFIMGIYLITIAVYSVVYSEIYGVVDQEWRSGINCSIIGSLAVISSETSCFLMVVLTAFRLTNVYMPIKSMISTLGPWKLSVAAAWILSILLGIAPMWNATSQYFIHEISFSSKFHREGTWDVAKLEEFVYRYAELSNFTVTNHDDKLKSIETFLAGNFPESIPVRMFGYYGETSVCLPRFFVGFGESSWAYTFSIITINFLCFVFIAVGYGLIYQHSTKASANIRSSKSDKQAAKMQKRIARIIATDFCCWIPICIASYVRFGGIVFSNIIYQISAVFLLPVNSVINPFLFSSLPDKLINFFAM